jgi:lysophospholipase L1-like esterase
VVSRLFMPQQKRRPGKRAVTGLVSLLTVVGLLAIAPIGQPSPAGAAIPQRTWYLALGGSASVGVQPTLRHPHGQPTDDGYAEDLARLAGKRWPGLQLKRLGCPGETTITMLLGGSRCHYQTGSQLSQAVAFLRSHSVRLVTVDLGFNDIRGCLESFSVNASCLASGLRQVRSQLTTVLATLRAASPSSVIVGVGHYDPFIADSLDGVSGRHFASASITALDQLDATLREVYTRDHLRMANVSRAFDAVENKSVTFDGHRTNEDVERVCELTWMCHHAPLGPNLHPDDRGYWAIADAIDTVIGAPNTVPLIMPGPAASVTKTA